MPDLSRYRSFMLGAAGSLFIMIFAFVNGYALIFNDTRQYVRGPAIAITALTGIDLAKDWKSRVQEVSSPVAVLGQTPPAPVAAAHGKHKIDNNGFVTNRSVYYGALALLGYIVSDFWLTIFVQSFVVATSIAIIDKLVFGPTTVFRYFIIVAGLSLLTGLGPYSAYIMPDIFSSIVILNTAILMMFYRGITLEEVVFSFLSITFGVLAHPSHWVIVAALFGLFAIYTIIRRTMIGRDLRPMLLLAGALFLGAAGQVAFNKAIERFTGQPGLVLPHFMAHLEDMGPGTRYLMAKCPVPNLVLCNYKDRLPKYWEDFVADADPKTGVFGAADLATKHQLSAEQGRYALAVFEYDPAGTTFGLLRDGVRQIGRFSLLDMRVTPKVIANYEQILSYSVLMKVQDSSVGRSNTLIDTVSAVSSAMEYVSAAWILAYLLILYFLSQKQSPDMRAAYFGLLVLLGMFLNAMVCGILASPIDRYQARVAWLAPFVGLLFAADAFIKFRATRPGSLSESGQTGHA